MHTYLLTPQSTAADLGWGDLDLAYLFTHTTQHGRWPWLRRPWPCILIYWHRRARQLTLAEGTLTLHTYLLTPQSTAADLGWGDLDLAYLFTDTTEHGRWPGLRGPWLSQWRSLAPPSCRQWRRTRRSFRLVRPRRETCRRSCWRAVWPSRSRCRALTATSTDPSGRRRRCGLAGCARSRCPCRISGDGCCKQTMPIVNCTERETEMLF